METPAVIREVFRRPGVAHTQHPMVEEPAGPSGNGGVVRFYRPSLSSFFSGFLPLQLQLSFLWQNYPSVYWGAFVVG